MIEMTPDEITLDGIRDIRLYQNRDGYRFSVDALLLYYFVDVNRVREIVDLGAGSGIVGLLLAGKYTSSDVLLVELQESLHRLAESNIALNGAGERVRAMRADIRELRGVLSQASFDLAVSNPPFRRQASGRISNGEERAVARHELRLKLPELAEAAAHLLRPRGRFFMIYHPERLLETVDTLRRNRLEPKRVRFVHNDLGAVSKIVLIEAVKDGRPGIKIERPLFIYDQDGSYTDEVRKIYGQEEVRGA